MTVLTISIGAQNVREIIPAMAPAYTSLMPCAAGVVYPDKKFVMITLRAAAAAKRGVALAAYWSAAAPPPLETPARGICMALRVVASTALGSFVYFNEEDVRVALGRFLGLPTSDFEDA